MMKDSTIDLYINMKDTKIKETYNFVLYNITISYSFKQSHPPM